MSVRPQPSSPQSGRKRSLARWTPFEVVLIIVSMVLIAFPLYIEAYRWVNPAGVPAAPRQQEVPSALPEDFVPTPAATDPPASTEVPTDAAAPATEVPVATDAPATEVPAATEVAPAATSDIRPDARVTLTPVQPSAVPTTPAPTNTTGPSPTPGGPTAVPSATSVGPSATPGGPTVIPTNTLVPPTPGGPTLTPTITQTALPGAPPLRLVKNTSQTSASPGESFSFALAVFTDNPVLDNTIRVQDSIDQQLEITSATASSGTCSISGQSVSCSVSAKQNNPASINITVRVRVDAPIGSRLQNQAVAQDGRKAAAASDIVYITVEGAVTIPTLTTAPTSGPGPTAGPSPTAGPGPSPTTGAGPTSGPAPTSKPSDGGGNGGGNGGGDSGGNGDTTAVPDVPGAILPPTPADAGQLPPQPQPVGATAVRPRATARPGTAPTARPGTTPTTGPGTATAVLASLTPVVNTSDGVFFTLASDWGSAFPGQDVNFVIAARNTKVGQSLRNIVLAITLPANLEITGAPRSDRGDPIRSGNRVSLNIAELAPGAAVEISIPTKIKAAVEVDTRIVSQAEMRYEGLAAPLYSNIVPILIVGQAAQPTPTASAVAPSATAKPAATATIALASAATAVATTTKPETAAYPAPTSAAQAPPAAGQPNPPALPNTNSGVPISGMALLGMTLLIRTVRLHRSQSRI